MNNIMIELNPTIEGIKGYVTEIIAKLHLESSGFNVIHTGKEHYSQLLADFSVFKDAAKPSNTNDDATFSIYNNILGKIPDLMLFKAYIKENEIKYTIRFVEVKFRRDLPNSIKQLEEPGRYRYDTNSDDLAIKKYVDNISTLNNGNDAGNINFFIYLIFFDATKKEYTALIGKAGKNIIFYEINNENSKKLTDYGWGDITLFCQYVKKVTHFLSDDFITSNLLLRSRDDIQCLVKDEWSKYVSF